MLDLKPREESGSRRPVVRYNLKDLMSSGKSENSFLFFLYSLQRISRRGRMRKTAGRK